MKKVKIFLASSITDLADDRLAIGDFFRQLNEVYIDLGVYFSLIKCEDYDNSIALSGKQSQYDAEIRDSELCFFLFFRKIGEYTLHEFDVALEAFRESGRPKIVTYVKYVDDISTAPDEVVSFMQRLDGEIRHYYNTYGHIDTLKLGMLMQIKLLGLDSSRATEISVNDGNILLMGEKFMSVENIPIFSGNERLSELTENKKRLSIELAQARGKYLAEPSACNESQFLSVSAEYNSAVKELSSAESEMLSLVSAVAELTADGRVLTYRQKEALKLFNKGDFSGAQNILDGEEREAELKSAEARYENAKNEFRGYVEENLLWIKAQRARGIDKDADLKIRNKFERAVEIVEKYDLEREANKAYMQYLYSRNEYRKAIKIAEDLLMYYNRCGEAPNKTEFISIYNLLGLCYDTIGMPDKSESYYAKIISMSVEDGKIKDDEMQFALMYTLINRGRLCLVQKEYAKSEKNFKVSEAIYKELNKKYPKNFDDVLTILCGNLGALYLETGRLEEAEDYIERALKLYEEAKEHGSGIAEELESEVVISYVNIANLHFCRCDYAKAETAFETAEKVIAEFALKDPEAYRSKLSFLYLGKAGLMVKLMRFEEADECAQKAISAIEILADKNEIFKANLAIVYNNVGVMYMELSRNEEALESLKKAADVYTEVYKNNRKILLPLLAKISMNMGSTLFELERYSESLAHYRAAADMLDELCAETGEIYELDRAFVYTNLCTGLSQLEFYDEAIEYGKKAVDTYEAYGERKQSLNKENLALAYSSLAGSLGDNGNFEESLEYYKKALEIQELLAEQSSVAIEMLAKICYNISIVCDNLGDYESEQNFLLRAENEYRKYYELFPDIAIGEYLPVLRQVCVFYIECQEIDTARGWIDIYLDFTEQLNAYYHGSYQEWVEDAKELLDSIPEE